MARGGKRPGAGRKANPHKGKPPTEPTPKQSRAYDPQVALEAQKLCELGATSVDLADFFGVSVRTIDRWAVEFIDFCYALKAGKEAADDRVERSLYHRAVGYTHDAVKVFQFQGQPLIVPFREHVAPDVGAMTLWLKNRRPDKWRDKQDVEHSGSVTTFSFTLDRPDAED